MPPTGRIYTRYRSGPSKSKRPGLPRWFFVLLCLGLTGLLVWVWWRHPDFAQGGRFGGGAPAEPGSPGLGRPEQPKGKPQASSRVAGSPAEALTQGPRPQGAGGIALSRQEGPGPGSTNDRGDGLTALARPAETVFEAQVALTREGISCGSIDGVLGSQTRAALKAFQRKHGIALTGILDDPTRALLLVSPPLTTTYTVTTNDLERLLPLSKTWLGKSEQPRLDYENLLELVSEKAFAHPQFIRQLNPLIKWETVAPGALVTIPNVQYPAPLTKAELIRISLSEKTLEAFDAATNLLVHFPCSIGRLAEMRPVGELHVVVSAPDPNYTFSPEVFPESEEARRLGRKLILLPGPNNPVGSAWIGLDRPGYGIHGTPLPELVGRTESHGCFRLSNWNADYLRRLVNVGTPVQVDP